MQLLAHRGLWHQSSERNSFDSLQRALVAGFGLETDVRDIHGSLVISHDPPSEPVPLFVDLLDFYDARRVITPLAINVKADGLRFALKALLQSRAVGNYFCFDMSTPEMLAYRRDGLTFFTRESEYETQPVLYADATGVWLDMFTRDWVTPDVITRHIHAGKKVALVSPELHGRPHQAFWNSLRSSGLCCDPSVMLCTDYPQEASEFFS